MQFLNFSCNCQFKNSLILNYTSSFSLVLTLGTRLILTPIYTYLSVYLILTIKNI